MIVTTEKFIWIIMTFVMLFGLLILGLMILTNASTWNVLG